MADSGQGLVDQWYYLDDQQTRGPVPSADIVKLIHSGSLSSSAQVAQAGWQTWSPASTALAHLLAPPPPPRAPQAGCQTWSPASTALAHLLAPPPLPLPGAVKSAPEPLTYAIKV